MGVTILARPQLRARLEKPNPGAGGAPGTPAPAAALPLLTYDAPMTFHMNGEDVQLIPDPAAHTDGDTMVKFVNADVIMTGDFYRSIGYPNIDRANGGSLKGMLDGLNAIIELAGPSTKIVPGHGAVVDKTAVAAHRDMLIGVRDKIAPMVQKGMTRRAGRCRQADGGLRREGARHRHDRRTLHRAGVRRAAAMSPLNLLFKKQKRGDECTTHEDQAAIRTQRSSRSHLRGAGTARQAG